MTPPDTPLDSAHAVMEAAPDDDRQRLAFFRLFADTELFVMLVDEAEEATGGVAGAADGNTDGDTGGVPGGDAVRPALFDVEGARYLLAFDREERLTAFTGRITPYAAMPGRGLAAMITGEGIGIALNAELPSAMLLPPEAVDWLADMLSRTPGEVAVQPRSFHAPLELPDELMTALRAGLAASAGLVAGAWLAGVTYEDETTGHLIGFAGAAPGSEPALAAMVREALVFSGLEEGWLDVAFLAADDPLVGGLAGVGRELELPAAAPVAAPVSAAPSAPGVDPDRPPRLN